MLATLPFVTPYKRPVSFADPGGDWTEADAARVLNTPDAELGWWEFRAIFQVGLPLASYSQGVYFLPFAFKYLKERRDGHNEFVADLVWFVSEHKSELDSSKLTHEIESAFQDCLANWTEEFTVVHFDKAACESKGWGLAYDDLVKGSHDVLELLEELGCRKSFMHVGEVLVTSMSMSRTNPIQSAWYLEYCVQCRQRAKSGLWRHAPKPNFEDRSCINHHVDLVMKTLVSQEKSPTYWNDVFAWLGI